MWFYIACAGPIQVSISGPAKTVLTALRESVMRRTSLHRIFQVYLTELNSLFLLLFDMQFLLEPFIEARKLGNIYQFCEP